MGFLLNKTDSSIFDTGGLYKEYSHVCTWDCLLKSCQSSVRFSTPRHRAREPNFT